MMLRLILLFLAFFINVEPVAAKRVKAQPADPAQYQNKPIPPGATQWHCHYNGGGSILCNLASAGNRSENVSVDPRLPRAVHDILNNPAELAGSLVSIPLHGVPYDMEMVGKLAEAVMCGRKTSCGIVFGASHAELLANIAVAQPLVLAGR